MLITTDLNKFILDLGRGILAQVLPKFFNLLVM